MLNETVAAVVVTYNRKGLLLECLHSIRNQTKLPDSIFIIDNNSTDGTPELLLESGYISELPKKESDINQLLLNEVPSFVFPKKLIQIKYIRKYLNDGGAGGFFEGMKQAYESGFGWIWMMDDDGLPDANQLKTLFELSQKHCLEYSNALVINKDNHNLLAFRLGNYIKHEEITEKQVINNYVAAFNGTFISKKIIDNIGFIKREMFIWGDEREYTNRVRKNGYKIGTVLQAIHYHPKVKGVKKSIFPFNIGPKITIKPKKLAHIFYRNNAYNNKLYGNKNSVRGEFLIYFIFFLIRANFRELIRFIRYYNKGLNNDFS